MYSIVELRKDGIIELCRVKAPEEACDMFKKWMDYLPESKIEMLECFS